MTRRPIRWLKEHPFAADSLLAGFLLVCVIVSILTADTTISGVTYREPNAFAIILGVMTAVPVAWRRRKPLPALVVIGVGAVVYEAVGFAESAGTLAVLIGLYSVAAHCDRRRSLTGAAFTAVGVIVVFATARWGLNLGTIVSNVVIFGTAWILGDNLRNRRAYLAGLEDRAARLDREQVEQAQRAVADERARIARELHDVVAHNVSVMVVQAGAARRTIERDPDRAREALTSVEATGRQALDEMRRLLGVLRTEDEATELRAPQPSVIHLDALVAHVREAGLPVELVVEGEPRPLMSGVDMSAFRIVQEALTNSLKHAGPAHAQVRLRYGDHDLCLEVVDDGRGLAADAPASNGGGHGLVGIRERVALFGGDLEAGPRTGGGFVVSARFPLEPVQRVIRVLLVDDQPLLRAGFRMILEGETDIEVVGEAADGVEAIDAALRMRPDLVLMDIRMPNLDGVEATRRLAGPNADEPVKVLILTTFDLDEYVIEALRAGASGFLLKDVPPEDLVTAIRTIAGGDALIAPSVTRRLIDRFARHLPTPDTKPPPSLGNLTEREVEVLTLMARGLSNAELAEALFVSETTVKTRVGRVLMKLGLRDRVQAVVLAYETGLVQPGG